MAYTINRTDGSIFAVVGDGTINTDSSLVLVGKNYSGYGEFQNENFLRLLENGANNTPPTNPIVGQLWYDRATNILKVFNGTSFRSLGGAVADPTAPVGNNNGDFWWDTSNKQLKVWDSSSNSFIVVGPASTSAMGVTGAVPQVITDTTTTEQVVVELRAGGVLVGLISSNTFTPQTPIPNFPSPITAGITLRNGTTLNGTATNANALGGVLAGDFVQRLTTTAQTMASRLNTSDLAGFGVGAGPDLRMYVASGTGRIESVGATVPLELRTNGSARLTIATGGAITTSHGITVGGPLSATTLSGNGAAISALSADNLTAGTVPNARISGSYTGLANLTGSGTATFNAFSGSGASLTGLNAANITTGILPDARLAGSYGNLGHLTPGTTNTHNLGSSALRWNTVFATTFDGTATTALYADLAEKFVADAEYAPGTLVEIGGEKEVTMCVDDACENVFGVISTDPAYLMNNGVDGVAVALSGRVPVRVVGEVKKGDRLVSAGNGCARAAKRDEWTAFNIIGRALEDKNGKEEGLIEAVVVVK